MDRLALALITLGLIAGLFGLSRSREAMALDRQAMAVGERVRTAERELTRLLHIPRDPRTAGPAARILGAFTRRALPEGGILGARLRLAQAPEARVLTARRWAPLAAEPLEIQLDTTASPLAVQGWLRQVVRRHPIALTSIAWDGWTVTIRGVVLGR